MKTQSRSFNSKWMTFTEGVGSTMGFVQVRLDGRTMNILANLSNSLGLDIYR